jgi:hypothetical protein
MHRKTIALLYPLGLLFVIGSQLFLKSTPQPNIVFTVGGSVVSIAGGILIMISWIGSLINSAKTGRWGWFLCLLFFALFTLIVYIFAGPDSTQETRDDSSIFG